MRHDLFSCAAALALVVFHPISASSAEPLPPEVDYRHVHQDAAMDLFNLRDGEALERHSEVVHELTLRKNQLTFRD